MTLVWDFLLSIRQIDGHFRAGLPPLPTSPLAPALSLRDYNQDLGRALLVLIEEQHRRVPPTRGILDETLAFVRELAEFLTHPFLRRPSTFWRIVRRSPALLLGVLFTPSLANCAFSPDPDDWTDFTVTFTPDPFPPSRDFLLAVAGWIAAVTRVGMDEDSLGMSVRAEPRTATALFLAVEAERKAHEAILDAVLAWRRRKSEMKKGRRA